MSGANGQFSGSSSHRSASPLVVNSVSVERRLQKEKNARVEVEKKKRATGRARAKQRKSSRQQNTDATSSQSAPLDAVGAGEAARTARRRLRLGIKQTSTAKSAEEKPSSVPFISSNFQDLYQSVISDEDDQTPRYLDSRGQSLEFEGEADRDIQAAMLASMQPSQPDYQQDEDAVLAAALQASLLESTEPSCVPALREDAESCTSELKGSDSATAALLRKFQKEDEMARSMENASHGNVHPPLNSLFARPNPFSLLETDENMLDPGIEALLGQMAGMGPGAPFDPVGLTPPSIGASSRRNSKSEKRRQRKKMLEEARAYEEAKAAREREHEARKIRKAREREELEMAQLASLRMDLPPNVAEEAVSVFADLKKQYENGSLGYPPSIEYAVSLAFDRIKDDESRKAREEKYKKEQADREERERSEKREMDEKKTADARRRETREQRAARFAAAFEKRFSN